MFHTGKGISPIVAIVLLLMMTIAAAGGTYYWWTNIASQQQQKTEEILGTKMEVIDLTCDQQDINDRFRLSLQNTGSVNIDTSEVNIFIRNMADGTLSSSLTNLDWSEKNFRNPGGFDTIPELSSWVNLNADIFLNNGMRFKFEINFLNSDYKIEEICTVREISP